MIYIYIYIYICVCVCEYTYIYMCEAKRGKHLVPQRRSTSRPAQRWRGRQVRRDKCDARARRSAAPSAPRQASLARESNIDKRRSCGGVPRATYKERNAIYACNNFDIKSYIGTSFRSDTYDRSGGGACMARGGEGQGKRGQGGVRSRARR